MTLRERVYYGFFDNYVHWNDQITGVNTKNSYCIFYQYVNLSHMSSLSHPLHLNPKLSSLDPRTRISGLMVHRNLVVTSTALQMVTAGVSIRKRLMT